jgi:hypothetical protein
MQSSQLSVLRTGSVNCLALVCRAEGQGFDFLQGQEIFLPTWFKLRQVTTKPPLQWVTSFLSEKVQLHLSISRLRNFVWAQKFSFMKDKVSTNSSIILNVMQIYTLAIICRFRDIISLSTLGWCLRRKSVLKVWNRWNPPILRVWLILKVMLSINVHDVFKKHELWEISHMPSNEHYALSTLPIWFVTKETLSS